MEECDFGYLRSVNFKMLEFLKTFFNKTIQSFVLQFLER